MTQRPHDDQLQLVRKGRRIKRLTLQVGGIARQVVVEITWRHTQRNDLRRQRDEAAEQVEQLRVAGKTLRLHRVEEGDRIRERGKRRGVVATLRKEEARKHACRAGRAGELGRKPLTARLVHRLVDQLAVVAAILQPVHPRLVDGDTQEVLRHRAGLAEDVHRHAQIRLRRNRRQLDRDHRLIVLVAQRHGLDVAHLTVLLQLEGDKVHAVAHEHIGLQERAGLRGYIVVVVGQPGEQRREARRLQDGIVIGANLRLLHHRHAAVGRRPATSVRRTTAGAEVALHHPRVTAVHRIPVELEPDAGARREASKHRR